jgi:hypothetical protein
MVSGRSMYVMVLVSVALLFLNVFKDNTRTSGRTAGCMETRCFARCSLQMSHATFSVPPFMNASSSVLHPSIASGSNIPLNSLMRSVLQPVHVPHKLITTLSKGGSWLPHSFCMARSRSVANWLAHCMAVESLYPVVALQWPSESKSPSRWSMAPPACMLMMSFLTSRTILQKGRVVARILRTSEGMRAKTWIVAMA